MIRVKWQSGTVVRATATGPIAQNGEIAGGCGLVCDPFCERGENVWWLIHLETGHAICHWPNFSRRKAMKAATPIVAGFDWSFTQVTNVHRFDPEILVRLRSVFNAAGARHSDGSQPVSAKVAKAVQRMRSQTSAA